MGEKKNVVSDAAVVKAMYTPQMSMNEEQVLLVSVPQRLKHQTKMLLVVEVPEKAKAVELVIRISIIQLLEEFQLFQTSFLPVHQKHMHIIIISSFEKEKNP